MTLILTVKLTEPSLSSRSPVTQNTWQGADEWHSTGRAKIASLGILLPLTRIYSTSAMMNIEVNLL